MKKGKGRKAGPVIKKIFTVLLLVILLGAGTFVTIALRQDIVRAKIDNLFFTYLRAHAEKDIHMAASVFYPEGSEEYNEFIKRTDYFANPNSILLSINRYTIMNHKFGPGWAKAEVDIWFAHSMYSIIYQLSFIKRDNDWYLEHDLENKSHLYDFSIIEDTFPITTPGVYVPIGSGPMAPPPSGPPLVIEDKSITEYRIKPDERVEYDTFRGCINLNRVYFPADYYYIDPQWFIECTHLYSIEVSPDCTRYYSEDGVVYTKAKDELVCYPVGKVQSHNLPPGEFIMPDTVQVIKDYAFYKTTGISKVQLSKNLRQIGNYAFSGSKYLREIIAYGSLDLIGYSAFENCEKLKSFTLPDSVTVVEKEAFRGCKALESFNISPDSNLKRIGHSAFENCRSLKSFYIPQGINKISHWMFTGCTSLEEITMHTRITEIGLYAFKDCASLKNFYINQNITYVNRGAFYGCEALSLKIYFKSVPIAWHMAWDDGFNNSIEWNYRV